MLLCCTVAYIANHVKNAKSSSCAVSLFWLWYSRISILASPKYVPTSRSICLPFPLNKMKLHYPPLCKAHGCHGRENSVVRLEIKKKIIWAVLVNLLQRQEAPLLPREGVWLGRKYAKDGGDVAGSSRTSLQWSRGFWRRLLGPSLFFIGKSGLHCVHKEPNNSLESFKNFYWITTEQMLKKKIEIRDVTRTCRPGAFFGAKFGERKKIEIRPSFFSNNKPTTAKSTNVGSSSKIIYQSQMIRCLF